MMMAMSTLRLILLVEDSCTLIFALFQGLKPLRIYFGICFFFWYSFAAIATWIFGRPEDAGPHHESHFDTFSDSFLTMFQLIVGEGWHEVHSRTTSSPYLLISLYPYILISLSPSFLS